MRKTIVLCLVVALALFAHERQAYAYNQNKLKWKTIKTEHFEVHYHEGAEWTAQQVARIAEDVHGPLTELYDYEPPSPVHFVIKDTNDYANGAAFFYDNKIEIWATNLEFGLRGTTDWLNNVVTHEYTHIISIQASTKMPRQIPAVFFQAIGFESEKRSDVLQGYPNMIVSYPISGIVMPPWFAEGVAQYQSPDRQYDCWDSHRDMILRMAVLEDKMLTYDEMGFFGKSSLQSEQVYDHGYGLVRYIATTYGDSTLKDITREIASLTNVTMNGALKDATGKKGDELYDDWKASMQQRYDQQTAPIRANLEVGVVLAPDNIDKKQLEWSDEKWRWRGEGIQQRFGVHNCHSCGAQLSMDSNSSRAGFMTHSPTYNNAGTRIAFLSNKGSDFSQTNLFVMDPDGSDVKVIAGAVSSRPQFSPDDKKVIYARKVKVDKHGSTVSDLFVFDLDKEKEKRLTDKARCADPAYSRDGQSIVAVRNGDGTHRLVVLDADGKNERELFSRGGGAQFYNPQYSPDGSQILFGIFEGVTRDIAVIDADGSNFSYLMATSADERSPRWSRGGSRVVFASDRSGIFNIFEYDPQAGSITQLSNVVGGGFMPDLSPGGEQLVYAGYSGDGYRVLALSNAGPVATFDELAYSQRGDDALEDCAALRTAQVQRRDSYQLAQAPVNDPLTTDAAPGTPNDQTLTSEKYKFKYTPFQFYPRVIIYDGSPRLGLFLASFEMLDKQGFFIGASYGSNGEFDAFIHYEIRTFFPVLYADFFRIREKTTDSAVDVDPTSPSFRHSFDFDLRYDLWQADFGLKFELGPQFAQTFQNDIQLWWSHGEYRVNIDGKEFREDDSFLASFDGGWKYYVGDQANVQWTFRTMAAATDADVNPRGGRSVRFHYMRSFDDLFTSGEFLYGFRPALSQNHYNQYTLDWREYIGVPWRKSSFRVRIYGSIIDQPVDDFFWFYLGGMDGVRGYTYYSIGGRKGIMGSVTYRFPILQNIDRQLALFYLRDIYGGIFFEAGNAFESGFNGPAYKKSLGYEVRMRLGSYYIFPTAISFAAAYAFDPVAFLDPGIAGVPVLKVQQPGFSYYFTLGFQFDP